MAVICMSFPCTFFFRFYQGGIDEGGGFYELLAGCRIIIDILYRNIFNLIIYNQQEKISIVPARLIFFNIPCIRPGYYNVYNLELRIIEPVNSYVM